ncbi:hypothetical protein [Nitrosopumilus sp.]|uniref:hypothetical protein n=1 Tax=Nitrosopumilus sp. TaxID=2024843 RepID=UPI003B59E907
MSNTASLSTEQSTDATMSQLFTIDARSISLLPENVGIVMESSIQRYASMKTEDLPVVRLGRVNGKVYAINHYDVILGCTQSKKNVRCIIEEYEKLSDVMVQHFRDVMSNDVINTPLIYSSVDSLQERLKTDKLSVLKILGIEKNQYTRLLTTTNNISEAAISKLEEMVTELSKRKGLTAIQASIPIYMLEKISRVSDEKQQLKLIQIIESDLQTINDAKFFWMTPEQIDSILQLVRQDATHAENKREESTVAEFVEIEDIGKKIEEEKSTTTTTSKSNNATKENQKEKRDNQKTKPVSKKTKQIIDTIPNMLVIPDERGQPNYLVDKKNGAVTKVDSKSTRGIIKTEQMPSKRLYSIPLDVTKFLGMGNGDGDGRNSSISAIRHKNISGTDNLKSFAESQKDQTQRYTIFWNE